MLRKPAAGLARLVELAVQILRQLGSFKHGALKRKGSFQPPVGDGKDDLPVARVGVSSAQRMHSTENCRNSCGVIMALS